MSNSKVVYKYELPIDNEWHKLPVGKVTHVACVNGSPGVTIWIEQRHLERNSFTYRVFGTGHSIGHEHEHVGTEIAGPFVWHVYRQGLPYSPAVPLEVAA